MQNRAHGRVARFVVAAVGAAALTATAACATDGDPEAREAEVAQREREAAAHAEGRGAHPSPVEVVIEAAREDGFLSVEQEDALDLLADDLEGEREGFRALRDRLRASAVTAVRAGSADSAEFGQAIAEGVAAVEEQVQSGLDALEEVHAVLEPDQRAAVAENLRARLDAAIEARAERREQMEREDRRPDGLQRLASYLVLSPKQVEELQAIQKELLGEKKKLRPTADELHALIDAFEGEDFGEALDDLHEEKMRVLRARVARAGEKADTVLAVFTAEQRELLADLILEGPTKLLLGQEAAEERE